MSNKEQVRRFYEVLWDAHDHSAIPSILYEPFTFRGSLGQEKKGHEEFGEYVDMVHKVLGEYRCIAEQLVSEDDKVFAKMLFTGIHQGEFMGFQPTGKRVEWSGCALFSFVGNLISDVWALGDLESLELQLEKNAT